MEEQTMQIRRAREKLGGLECSVKRGARPPGHKTQEASVLHALIRVQDGGSTVCAVPHGEQTTLAGQQQAARGDNFLPNLTQLTAAELLALHSKIGEELRARGVARSANSPTGDLAEHLFCAAFGWTQAPNSERGYDATGPDGTRFQIKAVNSRERNFTKAKLAKAMAESDERLARYLKQLDEADKDGENAPERGTVERLQEKIAALRERRDRLDDHGKALADSGEDQISLTDPDARAMHSSSRVGVGYNIQIAVDTKHKLIVEQQVHNKVSDLGLLTETAGPARETLEVAQIDAVADRGYFKIEDIEACEMAGIVPYVPKPQRGSAVAKGFFPKDQFRYDAEADIYTCPGGAALRHVHSRPVRGEIRVFDYANAAACKSCALKTRCTTAAYRKVARYENEAVLDRMAKRLAARPGVLDERRESVEHPFGSVKQWMGQGAFLMRRLENVRAEFSLTAIAYNLRRAISLVGIPALIAAVRL